jgi:death-on-curing family protein
MKVLGRSIYFAFRSGQRVSRKSTYVDLAEVAAAYLYYLCQNHPFVDGNKRTALGACLVFLRLNGI